MSAVEMLGTVAAVVTISLAVFAGWRWARRVVIITMIQEPRKPVRKSRLSFEDIRRGVKVLLEDARQFEPDFVIGINRGGAIVGGMIARSLGKYEFAIIHIDDDHSNGVVIDSYVRGIGNTNKILLVDDAIRFGGHMSDAYKCLTESFPSTKIRTSVLLELQANFLGASPRTRRTINVDCAAFYTTDASVKLPWDVN